MTEQKLKEVLNLLGLSFQDFEIWNRGNTFMSIAPNVYYYPLEDIRGFIKFELNK